MKILIIANHYAVCSARYMTDAFIRLGHEVVHDGPAMGADIWQRRVAAQYVWTPQTNLWSSVDLVIYADSDGELLDQAAHVRMHYGADTPIVVWGVDNHVRDYYRPVFDHYFFAHRNVNISRFGYGGDKSTWLPCATDPVAFPKSEIAWGMREYDVCCLGVMYAERWALVKAMEKAGLKVLSGTGLVYDQYRRGYQNSRVALVQSIRGDLPIRLFEGAGMGCAVLADDIMDLRVLADSPVTTYYNPDQAVKMALELQQLDPDTAQRAADKASTWALGWHTWDIRAQAVIDWLNARMSA